MMAGPCNRSAPGDGPRGGQSQRLGGPPRLHRLSFSVAILSCVLLSSAGGVSVDIRKELSSDSDEDQKQISREDPHPEATFQHQSRRQKTKEDFFVHEHLLNRARSHKKDTTPKAHDEKEEEHPTPALLQEKDHEAEAQANTTSQGDPAEAYLRDHIGTELGRLREEDRQADKEKEGKRHKKHHHRHHHHKKHHQHRQEEEEEEEVAEKEEEDQPDDDDDFTWRHHSTSSLLALLQSRPSKGNDTTALVEKLQKEHKHHKHHHHHHHHKHRHHDQHSEKRNVAPLEDDDEIPIAEPYANRNSSEASFVQQKLSREETKAMPYQPSPWRWHHAPLGHWTPQDQPMMQGPLGGPPPFGPPPPPPSVGGPPMFSFMGAPSQAYRPFTVQDPYAAHRMAEEQERAAVAALTSSVNESPSEPRRFRRHRRHSQRGWEDDTERDSDREEEEERRGDERGEDREQSLNGRGSFVSRRRRQQNRDRADMEEMEDENPYKPFHFYRSRHSSQRDTGEVREREREGDEDRGEMSEDEREEEERDRQRPHREGLSRRSTKEKLPHRSSQDSEGDGERFNDSGRALEEPEKDESRSPKRHEKRLHAHTSVVERDHNLEGQNVKKAENNKLHGDKGIHHSEGPKAEEAEEGRNKTSQQTMHKLGPSPHSSTSLALGEDAAMSNRDRRDHRAQRRREGGREDDRDLSSDREEEEDYPSRASKYTDRERDREDWEGDEMRESEGYHRHHRRRGSAHRHRRRHYKRRRERLADFGEDREDTQEVDRRERPSFEETENDDPLPDRGNDETTQKILGPIETDEPGFGASALEVSHPPSNTTVSSHRKGNGTENVGKGPVSSKKESKTTEKKKTESGVPSSSSPRGDAKESKSSSDSQKNKKVQPVAALDLSDVAGKQDPRTALAQELHKREIQAQRNMKEKALDSLSAAAEAHDALDSQMVTNGKLSAKQKLQRAHDKERSARQNAQEAMAMVEQKEAELEDVEYDFQRSKRRYLEAAASLQELKRESIKGEADPLVAMATHKAKVAKNRMDTASSRLESSQKSLAELQERQRVLQGSLREAEQDTMDLVAFLEDGEQQVKRQSEARKKKEKSVEGMDVSEVEWRDSQ
uniref:Uncharacterized protein n=1 Tax=Chromera velia CCMP2878 TaxID=1169474 RepID=A0A0G4IFQ8_9ALVE|eukprot:Cvel_13975.t1-p1 / transcript=Cvel_13975.t1 / gene=Cvel_13975 / organism=Chromera_velia_CCMP2878 / gene_product=hypothetical protein / transcript_product=hypothetical protein / location=Cvel_scaffold976:47379-53484(+) / protein_length=1109 / sequence_SO=supercontig / SO=protein_coding / is_pseudo=false